MDLLQQTNFKCSVSSVLNKDVKQYGKTYMFDSEEDTSWSSNEGTPQWIALQFEELQTLSAFSFQFQGGFAGSNATIVVESEGGVEICREPFYPEDINAAQTFSLKSAITDKKVLKVKFIFASSTDFFGRIIVYKLKLFGANS